MTTLEILNPAALMTVQDLGRNDWRHLGVPRAGAMDPFALQAANQLLGNAPNAAAIEITGSGAAMQFASTTLFALAGADLGAQLNHQPVPTWTACLARAGQWLEFTERKSGARVYLAVAGGIAVAPVLGSRSTYLPGQFGGVAGRALQMGDTLSAAADPTHLNDPARIAGRSWPPQARPQYAARPVLRVLAGPHAAALGAASLQTLCSAPLQVAASSNRMGYRLAGLQLPNASTINLPSLGVLPGAIQVPPDGAPILLMADAQTTGGYPVVAVVIQADLPLAAQLWPGDILRFEMTAESTALAAWQQLQSWLSPGWVEDGFMGQAANMQ